MATRVSRATNIQERWCALRQAVPSLSSSPRHNAKYMERLKRREEKLRQMKEQLKVKEEKLKRRIEQVQEQVPAAEQALQELPQKKEKLDLPQYQVPK